MEEIRRDRGILETGDYPDFKNQQQTVGSTMMLEITILGEMEQQPG